ncbi:hypothetical protein BCF58_0622 [Chryseobacterium defluvii]|uniref:Uncharacterized protein n=1 Tax=Chryseobacterium defluvii TaxID=160396 RepID=A0A495SMG4_9FLAO|nr:hypothetical protein BCF58_0622 [Chryseobacterium defluvii]
MLKEIEASTKYKTSDNSGGFVFFIIKNYFKEISSIKI